MKKGFTLIELLVVVLIIGILSAIALPQYQKAVEKTHVAEAVQKIFALQKAVDLYLLANGYPASNTQFLGDAANGKDLLDIDISPGLDCSTTPQSKCLSKYFGYGAYCGPSSCYVQACRLKGTLVKCEGTNPYELRLDKTKDDNEWDRVCEYMDDERKYICTGLESQHFRTACC